MERGMRFVSATTTQRDEDSAVSELRDQVHAQVGDIDLDAVLLFFTPHFAEDVWSIAERLEGPKPKVVLGAIGEGVIGRDREIESEPGISLVGARLPDVELKPFELDPEVTRETAGDPKALLDAVGAPRDTNLFLMIGDPFSVHVEGVLGAFNTSFPGVPVVGGMASGFLEPNRNVLLLNRKVVNNGAVGIAFSGAIHADVIVSQGCRPIGSTFVVSHAHDNMIVDLGGAPPLERIREIVTDLPEEDRELLRNGLFVGRAIDPNKEVLGRGDFLIRGVIWIDRKTGAVAIGDEIQGGEKIQFQLRDAATAKEDLEMMLTPHSLFGEPSGAILFSCNGRGTRLYDHPNGDVSTIQSFFSDLELAGFFCAGEIGPIGGKNFLHGHTASLALIRPGK